ncbi:hypothetical protein SAMN04515648_0982 [Phyllobacterium sp. CL33Tsu]|uniref:hypothetical protein n=1 Tax=Phyllobacterium sp. CL33Tsu TaxID=1798191 RepID=UPI0008E6E12A|nr:hypothetical protein [Phyllobacterium sp. CL33Tsu]SFI65075.1 hypothetical protein SAMN04515648_0982 [Phyllobacterium sp. CL33Tsu]
MTSFTLDMNCLIAIEKAEPVQADVLALIDKETSISRWLRPGHPKDSLAEAISKIFQISKPAWLSLGFTL